MICGFSRKGANRMGSGALLKPVKEVKGWREYSMLDSMVVVLAKEGWILGLCLLGSISILLLARMVGGSVWRLQRGRCGKICEPLHGKLSSLFGLWKDLAVTPPKVVIGIIGYFLWFPLVVLNVLLLGVALEPLFMPTIRVVIEWAPYAGQYRLLPLLAAILLTATQIFWVILYSVGGPGSHHQQAGATSPQDVTDISASEEQYDPRIVFLMTLIMVMICFEASLAIYRGWFLMHMEMAQRLPTMWHNLMLKGGPLISGFLGLIPPLSMVFTTHMVFRGLVRPWLVGTACGAVWAMVGWHERPLGVAEGPRKGT
jgi:hypothetical protein